MKPNVPPVDYSVLDRPEVLPFLFHPRRTAGPVDARGPMQEMLIPVEADIGVGARFHMAHPGRPTILFFHGNGEVAADYDDIGPLFNRLGINFVVVDYRGYGCSGGRPSVSAMMADSYRLFDFVVDWRAQNDYAGPQIVMGRSLGSASAIELAARRDDAIDGLIVESGFAWAGPLLRRLGVDPERIGFDESAGFANVEKVRTVAKPTLIIHAEFDHIIPYADGEALYLASGAADKELVAIPGANHNDIFLRGLDPYMQSVVRMARKLI